MIIQKVNAWLLQSLQSCRFRINLKLLFLAELCHHWSKHQAKYLVATCGPQSRGFHICQILIGDFGFWNGCLELCVFSFDLFHNAISLARKLVMLTMVGRPDGWSIKGAWSSPEMLPLALLALLWSRAGSILSPSLVPMALDTSPTGAGLVGAAMSTIMMRTSSISLHNSTIVSLLLLIRRIISFEYCSCPWLLWEIGLAVQRQTDQTSEKVHHRYHLLSLLVITITHNHQCVFQMGECPI